MPWIEQTWMPHDGPGLPRSAKTGGRYQAYLPNKLSSLQLSLPDELVDNIATAERRLLSLTRTETALGLEGIARFLMRSEAISSSRIEGIAPAPDKVALAELAAEEPIYGLSRSAQLVANNMSVLRLAHNKLAHQDTVTLSHICDLQAQLLEQPRLTGIRTTQNWIGGSQWSPINADFVPPPATHVPELMDDVVKYLNSASHGALVQAAVLHAQFETIHPFADGNGRIGRALIHLVLERRGLATSPVLPVSMVLGTWSEGYVAGLTAFRNGDLNAWLDFFMEATHQAINQAERIAADVVELRDRWDARFREYRNQNGKTRVPRSDAAETIILRNLAEHPVLTASSASRTYAMSQSAAKRALDRLADAGILRKKVVAKGGTSGYLADEVLDLITLAERRLASTQFDTRVAPPTGRATPPASPR